MESDELLKEMEQDDDDDDSEFVLPPYAPLQPPLTYQPPTPTTPLTDPSTTALYHHRFLSSVAATEYPYYPVATRPLFSIYHHITPLPRQCRPQMPRAPHIEARGSQRLSPANPTSMAVDTQHASVTSSIRSKWEHDLKKEEPTEKAHCKRSGAFKPPYKHRRSPPKTASVTVIQPSTATYTRATDSVTATSGKRSPDSVITRSSSPPAAKRATPPNEGFCSPYPTSRFSVDPTYSLHVAVECHRATQQDADGDTPLHIAISQADEVELSLIRHLICLVSMSGRTVDIFNYVQQTPLHIAVITDNCDVTRLLLEAGANPNETDRNGLTAVHHACVNNSIPCLKTVLDNSKFTVDLNVRNYNGFAPLHATVMDNNMEMTNALLASGASVEVQDAKNGWSPLFHAIINQNQPMITRLVEAGAHVNAQSYSGNTALHMATGRGYTDVVRLLMRYGADMSVRNTHRELPALMSNDNMISSILHGPNPAPRPTPKHHDNVPRPSPSHHENVPMIRVPTRPRRDITTPHPLSQRRPPSRKSGTQQPLALVTHGRDTHHTHKRDTPHTHGLDTPARGRGRHRGTVGPSPLSYPFEREHSRDAPSPKRLKIDEGQNPSGGCAPPPYKRPKAEESPAVSSCRVPVIVRREAYSKEGRRKRTEVGEKQKPPHQRMPRVTQLLNQEEFIRETGLKNFLAKPLPDLEHSLAKAAPRASRSGYEMPVLKSAATSPTPATDKDQVDAGVAMVAKQMPTLELSASSSSPSPSTSPSERSSAQGANVGVAPSDYDHNKGLVSMEDPPSPILEMSDADDDEDDDEPMPKATPVSGPSPKQAHVGLVEDVSDDENVADDDDDGDVDEETKEECKDDNDNDSVIKDKEVTDDKEPVTKDKEEAS